MSLFFDSTPSIMTFQHPATVVFEAGSSLTNIPTSTFLRANIRAMTLPDGVVTIGSNALDGNQLTSLVLPDSLTSDPKNFLGFQGDSAARTTWNEFPIEFLTPAERAAFLAGTWYVQLTTSPGNPRGWQDYAEVRQAKDPDSGLPTGETFPVMGHLVNPTAVTRTYTNTAGQPLAPSETSVGQTSDGTLLPNYLFSHSPVLAYSADQPNLTPAEQTALSAALAVYWRVGETRSFRAPAIAGYTAPSPATRSMVLGASTNVMNFVYTAPTTGTSPGGGTSQTLANTGGNMSINLVIAAAMTVSGALVMRNRRRSASL